MNICMSTCSSAEVAPDTFIYYVYICIICVLVFVPYVALSTCSSAEVASDSPRVCRSLLL